MRIATVAAVLLLGSNSLPVYSATPPASIGQCSNTFVKLVTSRFGGEEFQFGSEDGLIEFTNGLGLYLYRTLRTSNGWGVSPDSRPISLAKARVSFSPNDPVKVCLEYVPTDCPSRERLGDRRGEIYYISNFRNRMFAYGLYGRNPCGGA
jgi:hypothetical protein